jgi:3-oxoacyl-[acyl-carrier protein] reductase
MLLQGKSAIVTGASQGIGAAIAREFAAEGAEVLITARSAEKLEATAAAIRADTGGRVEVLARDLTEPDAAAQAVEQAVAAFGKLDVVAHSAGATKYGDFFQLTDQDFVDGFALKYFGAVRMTRAAWSHLMRSRGTVLNIIGVGARVSERNFAIGGSVNSALTNFTKAMADRGVADGVRVNAIHPGPVLTPRVRQRLDFIKKDKGLTDDDAAMAEMVAQWRVTRIGLPEDVARLAAFVVSDKGSLLQGSVIDLDGGATRAI